jgi:glutathione S-transferase
MNARSKSKSFVHPSRQLLLLTRFLFYCSGIALYPLSSAFNVVRFGLNTDRLSRRCGTSTFIRPKRLWLQASTIASPSAKQSEEREEGDGSSESLLILYGHPGTRSPLVNWACYELGLSDFKMASDLSTNPHPFGQVPCLVHKTGVLADASDGEKEKRGEQDVVVFESGAILQYLYTLHAQRSDSPLPQSQMWSIFSWIAWANASLDPICFLETPQGKVYDTGLRVDPASRKLKQLNALLSRQKFLLGDEFTVADVAVASYLLYVVQFFPDVDLSPWPATQSYMLACAGRPSYRKAFGDRVASYLLDRLS